MTDRPKIGALMTVYNEAEHLEFALRSAYDSVDYIALVEGAYQEIIDLGAAPFSDDGTLDIIDNWRSKDQKNKIIYTSFNGQTDKDHRNVGIKELKEKSCDWFVIVDADEMIPQTLWQLVYKHIGFPFVRVAYFKSMTFVNDYYHYVWQEFPRLFRMEPGFLFDNDNFGNWTDINWMDAPKTKICIEPYYHFAFVKGIERFELKKSWWESRFKNRMFHYDWNVIEENGEKIIKPEKHIVYELKEIPKMTRDEFRAVGKEYLLEKK